MGGVLFGGCGMENFLGIGSGGFSSPNSLFIDWVSVTAPWPSKNPILSILQMPFGSLEGGEVGGSTIETITVHTRVVSAPEPNLLVLLLPGLALLAATRWRLAARAPDLTGVTEPRA